MNVVETAEEALAASELALFGQEFDLEDMGLPQPPYDPTRDPTGAGGKKTVVPGNGRAKGPKPK